MRAHTPWCSTVTAVWPSLHGEFITAIYNALPKATVVNKRGGGNEEEGGEETKGGNIRENKGDRAAECQFFTLMEDTV